MSEKFGDRMMQALKVKGLSRKKLAKKIGTSGPIVGRYERNDMVPSVEIAMQLAEALEVILDYLIGKTKLQLGKEAIERLESIFELSGEIK